MKIIFTLTLFLFLCQLIEAQSKLEKKIAVMDSLVEVTFGQGQYAEALEVQEKILRLVLDSDKENTQIHTEALNNMAVINQYIGDYILAEKYYLQVIEIRSKILAPNDPEIALAYSNVAVLYQLIAEYDKALSYNMKALKIREEKLGKDDPNYATTLHNMGYLYRELGEYTKAELLYQESLDLREKIYGKKHPACAQVLNNLGALYRVQKRYKEAAHLFAQSLEIVKAFRGEEHPNVANLLNNLGMLYRKDGQLEKAKESYEKALSIRLQIYGENHVRVGQSYDNLAVFYAMETKDYDAALEYSKKGLSVMEKVLGNQHSYYATTLNKMSHIYLLRDEVLKSIALAIQSFQINSIENFECDSLGTAIIEQCQKSTYQKPLRAIRSLVLLDNATYQLYLNEKNQVYLERAVQFTEATIKLVQKLQVNLANKEDKLLILQNIPEITRRGLLYSELLYKATNDKKYLDLGLYFAENNKSTILNSAIQSDNAMRFGEVPDTLIAEEKGFKETLDALKKELIEAVEKKDSIQISKVRVALIKAQQKQNVFKEKLAKAYPKYAKLQYQQFQANLSTIQTTLLTPNSALLEYYISEDQLFIFLINTDKVVFQKIDMKIKKLKTKIRKLRKGLSDYTFIAKKQDLAGLTYSEAAYSLYQLLIAPFEKDLEGIERLIIVPDNVLGHIPFEALLTEEVEQTNKLNYKKLPYLINRFSISYTYSINLLMENINHKGPVNNGKLIGFASSYPKVDSTGLLVRSFSQQNLRKNLILLPAVQTEVQALQDLIGGDSYYFGKTANEAQFKKVAGEYSVVHLAMHGILNKKTPLLSSLAFSENLDSIEDNFLEAHEISNLQLNNDLVVLSACETGYGKFEAGEGVMSLARSFMYAGVPSLVVSLWQVNDASTSRLMQSFYKNISNNMTKDEALRLAKLEYIETAPDIAAHPAFWSPFIQIGDSRAIKIKKTSGSLKWFIGFGVLLFLIGTIYFLRKKER